MFNHVKLFTSATGAGKNRKRRECKEFEVLWTTWLEVDPSLLPWNASFPWPAATWPSAHLKALAVFATSWVDQVTGSPQGTHTYTHIKEDQSL